MAVNSMLLLLRHKRISLLVLVRRSLGQKSSRLNNISSQKCPLRPIWVISKFGNSAKLGSFINEEKCFAKQNGQAYYVTKLGNLQSGVLPKNTRLFIKLISISHFLLFFLWPRFPSFELFKHSNLMPSKFKSQKKV